jgi:membrane protease YdiL (CAAX protease family)
MNILKAILATIIYIVAVELIGTWYFVASYWGIKYSDGIYYLVNGIIQLILVCIFIRYAKTSEAKLPQTTKAKWYILAVLLGALFIFFQTPLNWIYDLIAGSNHHITYNFNASRFLNVFTIAAVLLVPVCEELFFREFIQQKLQKRYRPVIAICIAALLFSAIHLPYAALLFHADNFTPHHAYIALFGGLMSGILYFKSKSIGPSIVMHITWNLFAMLA